MLLWLLPLAFSRACAALEPLLLLHNNGHTASFNANAASPDFASLVSLSPRSSAPLRLHTPPALWEAQFVTPADPVRLTARSECKRRSAKPRDSAQATFHWQGLEVGGGSVNVTVLAQLSATGACELRLAFAAEGPVGLWEWWMRVGSVGLQDWKGPRVLDNVGYGTLRDCAAGACGPFDTAYPPAGYQFLAAYDAAAQRSGLYFGAHDPAGATKAFHGTAAGGAVGFAVSAQPEGAGRALAEHHATFPVVVAAFDGDHWDAATQWYRPFALGQGAWAAKGPLSRRRGRDVPPWLLDVTMWVNSHWQGNDVFNTSGGAPDVVQERVLALQRRLRLGPGRLALHWYEWDALGYVPGSNYTDCPSAEVCGFDSHYPEYFPVRVGFDRTVRALQRHGVRVAPYINGRIFDMATASWRREDAEAAAVKVSAVKLQPSALQLHHEAYGNHVDFAVMCPHTRYWQDKIAQVVRQLVRAYRVDGVYIDQIGAAGAVPCFDPAHGHAPGGGHWWVGGYRAMLNAARDFAGPDAAILTESNAEPFMDGVNVYLTLVAFGRPPVGAQRIVPVFPAIYGGYYVGAGAIFHTTDLRPDPDVFAAKVALQFTFGAQIGWFSLGGRDNERPPMGLYDALMAPQHDPEVQYLRDLCAARARARDWLVFGRVLRDLPLRVNDTALDPAAWPPSRPVPALSAAYLAEDGGSVLVIVTSVRAGVGVAVSFALDMRRYGYPEAAPSAEYDVHELRPDGTRSLVGAFVGTVHRDEAMGPRAVVLWQIVPRRDTSG